MRIVSRYVLFRFLSPLALSFVSFVAVFVVVDLTDRLSAFLDQGASLFLILMYYVWYIPYIAALVLPMAMLLASLFCIGGLVRTRELTAMKAAGFSLYRIVLPIQVLALGISVGAFFLTDRVMPEANRLRAAVDRGEDPIHLAPIRSQVVLRDRGGLILSVGQYYRREKRGVHVTLERYHGQQLEESIRAEEMAWKGGRWVLHQGEARYFGVGGQETVVRFRTMRPEGLTLQPEDLSRETQKLDQMDLAQLRVLIARKVQSGEDATRERVEMYLRMAFPFASFVIVLFGVPLSSRSRRTGRPLLVGLCLLISFVYYGCIQAGRAMGWNGVLSPFWSAWGPNLLFLCLGAVMLVRAHK